MNKGVENASELEAAAQSIKDEWSRKRDEPVDTPAPPPPAPPPAPDTPPVAAEAPPATPPAATPPPADQTPEEFIEALIREAEGDTPAEVLKIPANARIPHKVNGEIVYRPAKEALTSSMREQDYIGKTQEVANARRELEQHANQLIADRARMQAREKWIAEERARLFEAQKSPEAWDRYQNHMRLLAEDPEYARTFEDALEGRARKAEADADAAAQHQNRIAEGVATAADWILSIGDEPAFRNVDLDRVRQVYATQLETGQAALDQNAVRRIFEAEAQYLTSSLTPLQSKVAELEAQIARLTTAANDPTAAHNRQTQHALGRAKTVPVTTGSPPAPSAPSRKVQPFTPREWPEVNAEWNRRRD